MSHAPQSSNSILMVRPANFSSNQETALTNEFQQRDSIEDEYDTLGVTNAKNYHSVAHDKAVMEFDHAVDLLREQGVNVIVIDDTPKPVKPDAIFPNNWFTTHSDGRCVLYPMQPVTRRPERRIDVLNALKQTYGFDAKHVIDLSNFERQEQFLEGTGSLVLDRINCRAYACRSARTSDVVFHEFCEQLNYQPLLFDAVGASGKAIYHTNVMMCIGTEIAIVCEEAVKQNGSAAMATLQSSHRVVSITLPQMAQFAGNMLEVEGQNGKRLLVMSQRAFAALTPDQIETVLRYVGIVSCPVETIEDASGGSIRCMMAEIFLPRNKV